MLKKWRSYPLYLLIVMNLISCLSTNQLNRKEPAQEANREYTIQLGDILDIKLFYNPELNELVKVRPDGKISLQLIQEVKAAGLTPSELNKILVEKYSGTIRQPEITVIVKDFANQKVYVGGEVLIPGVIPISGKLTCLQAIFQAGGFKHTAKLKSVVVLRNQGSDKPQFITLDLKGDLKTADSKSDILLEPYDIVFVPKTLITEMNEFVDQYIEKLIPISKSVGFSYFYNLRPGLQ